MPFTYESDDAKRSQTFADGGFTRANSRTASRMRRRNSSADTSLRALPMIANGSGSVRPA